MLLAAYPMQGAEAVQRLHRSTRFDVEIVYCCLREEMSTTVEETLNQHVFKSPEASDYRYTVLRNWSPSPASDRFWGLFNPGVLRHVVRADACVLYGHAFATMWLAILACLFLRKPFLLSSDAVALGTAQTPQWKVRLKAWLFPILYSRVACGVLVPSSASRDHFRSIGVPESAIFLTPYTVDNDAIVHRSAETDRAALRAEWNIPEDGVIFVFCAKLIERKRPLDLVQALAANRAEKAYAVIVGDGPLRAALEGQIDSLGLRERVRILGFVNYRDLPLVYTACDVLVHPAEVEPFGLIVNEAMLCGLPVIVAHTVGSGRDLVDDGLTGVCYRCGDIWELSEAMLELSCNPVLRTRMAAAGRKKIESWSPQANADAHERALTAILPAASSSG